MKLLNPVICIECIRHFATNRKMLSIGYVYIYIIVTWNKFSSSFMFDLAQSVSCLMKQGRDYSTKLLYE